MHSNYRYVEPYPFYVRRGEGVHLWDVDGHDYLDFNMGFGALASGHAHPKIVEALSRQIRNGTLYGYEWENTPELAERICRRFGMGQVRFSSTGLEATHHAMRVARAVTGKRFVLKFEGGYHGSHDTLLVGVKPRLEVAGPANRPNSAPAGPGILSEVTGRTLVAPFNDLAAVREIVREHARDVAAVIVEPVPMNMGLVLPEDGFMPGLRRLCDEVGALLVFDEIKTGAKYPRGGAGRVGVQPDVSLFGKSLACGIPFSVIATRAGLLDNVAPGRIAHAGTYNANPMAVTCALATLQHVLTEENLVRASKLSDRLAHGYEEVFRDHHVPGHVAHDGPSGAIIFSGGPVHDWRSFLDVDGERSMLYFYAGLNRDLIPSGTGPDEQWTVSVIHTGADIEKHLGILDSYADLLSAPLQHGEIEEAV